MTVLSGAAPASVGLEAPECACLRVAVGSSPEGLSGAVRGHPASALGFSSWHHPAATRSEFWAAFGVRGGGVVPVNPNVCQTVTAAGGRYRNPVYTLLRVSVSWPGKMKPDYVENERVYLGRGASKTSGSPASRGRRVSHSPCAGADTVSQFGCH